ncbi:Hypothetical protein RG540_PA10540 (plasmid) [Neorhizobium galegae bv. orientalis str. HAMBI 540]|uniref:Uncharacterized protein n=1 Tax=Neorhizobium galegae bv. orientalis str. HAMBI 540 TaxID=1028800 RepID=A0A068T2M9_NEOGA|nr:Hypothetical protein RG540_PA10540 [Neorhizobium galegae bv. orientalis str. HAMBI 540]
MKSLYEYLSSERGLENGISNTEARLVYRINALPLRIFELQQNFGAKIDKSSARKIRPAVPTSATASSFRATTKQGRPSSMTKDATDREAKLSDIVVLAHTGKSAGTSAIRSSE